MMEAGRYYIGDLCYVMTDAEWTQFCDLTIKGMDCQDGEFELPDGRKFATYGTSFGDGTYYDQYGNSYSVDAGLIGCIKVNDIRAEKYENLLDLGAIMEFENPFVTSEHEGQIQFGHVLIET
jgi:hypothetical protein